MNILVTGANGQLGREIRRSAKGSRNHYVFTDVSSLPGEETVPLDITNQSAVSLICRSENVDVIVNCAGYTDVEKAESDLSMASLLNAEAPGFLAEAAREAGALLIHISTDFVFGGEVSVPYPEDFPPHPLNAYGATKLSGEKAVVDSGCRYVILRTAWLYSPYGKNFVKTMLRLTSGRGPVRVVCDQVGSPTSAADLAGFITDKLLDVNCTASGIYHYSGEGVASWYDFAVAIASIAGNDSCRIVPCLSQDYPSKAVRPHYSVLDKAKVRHDFGIEVPYWRDSLENCIERLKTTDKI